MPPAQTATLSAHAKPPRSTPLAFPEAVTDSGSPVFHWPVRVYYEDTDCGGVVYHTGYLRFMERARTEWLRSLGYDQSALRAELAVLFAVRRLEVDFRRPALLDDALDVATRVHRHRRAALLFEQAVGRSGETGETLCRAQVEVVCLDAGSLRPRALPAHLQREPHNVR